VNLARTLTKTGVWCLRFDYMGHGDSEGNFEHATVETRLSDIRCAIEYLGDRTGVGRIGLLGIRFGATLAALTCANHRATDFLILVSPIVSGKAYINQCLRSNLTTQMAAYGKIVKDRKALVNDLAAGQRVNVDGYLLTESLYQQMEAINLLEGSLSSLHGVLIARVSMREGQPVEENVRKLYMRYRAACPNTELLNVRGNHFWTDTKVFDAQIKDLQDGVLDWLRTANPSLRERERSE
jgi:pimeloyl-ACP methyl ester carboxylesterase